MLPLVVQNRFSKNTGRAKTNPEWILPRRRYNYPLVHLVVWPPLPAVDLPPPDVRAPPNAVKLLKRGQIGGAWRHGVWRGGSLDMAVLAAVPPNTSGPASLAFVTLLLV